MAIVQLFDANQWFGTRLRGGQKLQPGALGSYASFSMMWGLFESVACDGAANPAGFTRLSHRADSTEVARATLARIDDLVAFWQERIGSQVDLIVPDEGPGSLAREQREIVDGVFNGSTTSLSDKALVLMLCVHFIRKYLMRAAKSIDTLNDQLENMDIASQSLAALIAVSATPMYVKSPRRGAI